jgi:hypothetical protein
MTQQELAYMVLESIRDNMIVDDEKLSIRLLYDWIDLKRTEVLRKYRNSNPNNRIDLNNYQSLNIEVEVDDVTDAGDYPYSDSTTQLYEIVQSKTTIPNIVEDKSGPIIYSIESQDAMKLPFSIVSYDRLRFAGNGKFNSSIIFTAIRDNYLYFKYNDFFDTYTDVILKAIFESPRDLSDFDPETSRYPATLPIIEGIKNSIYDIDIRMLYGGKSDTVNDASGEIQ